MSSYGKLRNTWSGLEKYNLNGKDKNVEFYVPPVTLSLPQWRNYVSNGYNTLYGDAIIPGGTVNSGWMSGNSVYSGTVGSLSMYR
tara:strand:- start:105 stop:359 length:255 start_codon:yes stop_codon:yes gene_type:complete